MVYSQEDKNYATKADRKKFYNEISKKYVSEDIQKIWNSDAKNEIFDQWVDGRKESEIVLEFSTVIHELFHSNCNSINDGQNYYINKDILIYVPITEVYNSTKLNAVVRKGQQDSIFRYGLYVGGKNELPDGTKTDLINTASTGQVSSIQTGIYGMLEEFAAYYYGSSTGFHLEKYFIDKYGSMSEDNWSTYKHMVLGEGMAYYEFRLFMGWYLLHAKNKYPSVYKGLINNKPLRVVYTLMTEKFEKYLETAYKKIDAHITPKGEEDPTMAILNTLDLTGSNEDIVRFCELIGITEDDEIYKKDIKTVNGKEVMTIKILDKEMFDEMKKEYDSLVSQVKELKKTGSSNKANELIIYFTQTDLQETYLKSQMTKELKTELDSFKINGVTESNYKDYLK